MALTLLAGAALDLGQFVLCALAARATLRHLPADRSHSAEAFALFWYGVGIVNLLQAVLEGIAFFQDPGVPLALAVWNTRIAIALASFAGLVYYLGFVYTGRRGIRTPVILFYAMTFLLMQVWLNVAQASSTDTTAWRVDLHFANPAHTPLYTVVVLCFFLPPLVAACMYALTLRHARSPPARRRVMIMSASLAVYFAGLTLGYLDPSPLWGLIENLLGIGAAVGAMAAFREGARPVAEVYRHREHRARRSAEIGERVRQLI
jgi:hypothetical protein